MEYGVSSRTIKRDGDFAAGLNKLDPAQKQEILSGQKKIARSSIEALAKTDLIDAKAAADELNRPVKTSPKPVGEDRIKKLEAVIRTLAGGTLSPKSFERLLLKTSQLLALLQTK